MATYKGPVVFVHPDGGAAGDQGVHYPATEDGGHDADRPLFWDAEKEEYRDQTDDDPLHFDAYHQNHAVIQFPDDSEIKVSPEDADAVREFLAGRSDN